MRLDKWLKVSRLIKRREIAKRLCDAGDVKIDGKTAKASLEVIEGQTLEITIGKTVMTAKVVSIKPFASKENAHEMYEVVSSMDIGVS